MVSSSIRVLATLVVVALLSACGGGGDAPPAAPPATGGGGGGGGGPLAPATVSGESPFPTFSGTILEPVAQGGAGLAGVTIELLVPDSALQGGTTALTAVTDAGGRFLIVDPPAGTFECVVDGSTAGPNYATLHMMVDIDGAAPNTFANPVVLPVIDDANGADLSLAGGVAQSEAATSTPADRRLTVPSGTMVRIGGAAAAAARISITEVPASEVPMPLPDTVDGRCFVTIQPADATFESAGDPSQGVNVALPGLGLPENTLVDIWSFDHDAQDWVNRSAETGVLGVVDASGNVIANGAITAGGWHVWTLPPRPGCNSTVSGCVRSTSGVPIGGALVGSSFGQFAVTGPDGKFSMPGVSAYDISSQSPSPCLFIPVDFSVQVPVGYGGGRYDLAALDANTVEEGAGTLALGNLDVDVPTTGCVVVRAIDNGVPQTGIVDIIGRQTLTVELDSAGHLVRFEMPVSVGPLAGADDLFGYSAIKTFASDGVERSVGFEIRPGETTTVILQRARGTGDRDIAVRVFMERDNNAGPTPASAQVLLIGSGTPPEGLTAFTDRNGVARFGGAGTSGVARDEFDVTAILNTNKTTILASSVLGVDPPNGQIVIPVPFAASVPSATGGATIMGSHAPPPGENILCNTLVGRHRDYIGFGTNLSSPAPYTMSVNPGTRVDLVHVCRNQAENRLEGIVIRSAGPVAEGGTITVDLDGTGPDYHAYDQPLDVAVTGATGLGATADFFYDLPASLTDGSARVASMATPGGIGQNTGLTFDLVEFPGINRRMVFFSQTTETVQRSFVPMPDDPITNPTLVSTDMIPPPDLVEPTPGQAYATPESVRIRIVHPPLLAGGRNGYNLYVVHAGTRSSITALRPKEWFIYTPADRTDIALPRAPVPIIADPDAANVDAQVIVIDGAPVDWDALMSEYDTARHDLDRAATRHTAQNTSWFRVGPAPG